MKDQEADREEYERVKMKNEKILAKKAALEAEIERKEAALRQQEFATRRQMIRLDEIDRLVSKIYMELNVWPVHTKKVIGMICELKDHQAWLRTKDIRVFDPRALINSDLDFLIAQVELAEETEATLSQMPRRLEIANERNRRSAEDLLNAQIQLQKSEGLIRRYLRIKPWAGQCTTTVKDNSVHIRWKIADSYQGPARYGNQDYSFDHIFDKDASQDAVYQKVKPIVAFVCRGVRSCIFTYGQTGAGKSYTTHGPAGDITSNERGICQRIIEDIFVDKLLLEQDGWNVKVSITAEELYLREIRNLYGDFAFDVEVTNESQAQFLLQLAIRLRATSSTPMNDFSSRSHFVFGISVVAEREDQILEGHIGVVDLGGKDRQQNLSKTKTKEQNVSRSIDGTAMKAKTQESSNIKYTFLELRLLMKQVKNSKIRSNTVFARLVRRFLVFGSIALFFVNISPDPEQGRISSQTLKDAKDFVALQSSD